MSVLSNGATRPVVRKKAALCLLRLIRKAPPDVDVMPASEWAGRLATMLEERDPGLLLGLTTLLLGVVSRNYEGYEVCVPRMVHILERLKARDVSQDYTYYGLASPWLQIRVLRVLQYFPPPEDPTVLKALHDTLQRTLAGNEAIKNPNKANAVHAIVLEASALAVGLGDPELLTMAVAILARFLSVRESNLKYLALENMARLAQAPEVGEAVARHQKTVVACLHDPDISIRRRALDLVFTTATTTTAPGVVDELLRELPHSDFTLREELVLKAAVLAERFPPSSEWYVDSMLRLMEAAGDTAVDDVWHSIVQLVAGEAALQQYAAEKAAEGLRRGAASDVFLRCASFLLGEHGKTIAGSISLKEQFDLLHKRFPAALPETKAMMLTGYEKLRAAAGPEDVALKEAVAQVLDRYSSSGDAELQQRAIEYKGLSERPGAAAVALQPLPPWEKRASLLLRRLTEKRGDTGDEAREQPVWLQEVQEKEEKENGGGDGVGVVGNGQEEKEEGEEGEKMEEQEQPPVVPDLLDLLDLSDDVAVAAQPLETEQQPSTAASQDPALAALALAGLDDLAVPSHPPTTTRNPFAEPSTMTSTLPQQPPPIEPVGDIIAWFHALCQAPSGILYEDAYLQVGMKISPSQTQDAAAATNASLRLDLFLGNKSPWSLARMVCSVPPNPAFALALAPPPIVLEPGRQVQLPLEATCLAPFVRPPVIQLGYTLGGGPGGSMARTLTLPLVTTKFCTPVEVPAAVFTARWAQVVGAPFKLSQQVPGFRGGGEDVGRLLSVLGMALLPEVSGGGAVAAACVFHCGPGRQVPCMIKVEGVGGDGAAVVVATADALVTDGLRSELSDQLARLA